MQQPAYSLKAVTPSDSVDIPAGCRGLWVGNMGDVRVLAVSDDAPQTLVGVSGLLPVQVKRVYSTSTTATAIVALY